MFILKSSKRPTWEWFYILCTTHGSLVVIICWPSTCSPHIHGDTSGWLEGHIQFDYDHPMTSRLCLWEFDKLPKPKAKYIASKKKLFSLTGHAISSISTSYQVKFTVGKYVPLANPPYIQDHLLSGRLISGLYSSLNKISHLIGKPTFYSSNGPRLIEYL